MSVTSMNQDNVDEHLIQHDQTAETKTNASVRDDTKTDHEKWLRYKNVG
jgi:hypothetical protein